jgi:hypothetical protein
MRAKRASFERAQAPAEAGAGATPQEIPAANQQQRDQRAGERNECTDDEDLVERPGERDLLRV